MLIALKYFYEGVNMSTIRTGVTENPWGFATPLNMDSLEDSSLIGRRVQLTSSIGSPRNGDIGEIVRRSLAYEGNFEVKILTGSDAARAGNGINGNSTWNIRPTSLSLLPMEAPMQAQATEAPTPTTERIVNFVPMPEIFDSAFIGRRVNTNYIGRMPELSMTIESMSSGIIRNLSTQYDNAYKIDFDSGSLGGSFYHISPKYLLVEEIIPATETLSTEEVKKNMKKSKTATATKDAKPKNPSVAKKLTKKQQAEADALAALVEIPKSKDYVRILCAQIGVDMDIIPETIAKTLFSMAEKPAINEAFFAWHASPKAKKALAVKEIDKEILTKLENLIDMSKTNIGNNIKANIEGNNRQIQQYYKDIDSYNARTVAEYLKLDKFMNSKKHNMAKQVLDITKSGWFTFEPTRSNLTSTSNNEVRLTFSTKNVNITHQDKGNSLHFDIDLGSYFINYYPYRACITVNTRSNNLMPSGYMHPHIAGNPEGSICWGNAKQTYTECMQELNPSRAFDALQSLLQAYGESPYTRISYYKELYDALNKVVEDKNGSIFKPVAGLKTRMEKHNVPRTLEGSIDEISQSSRTHRYFKYWNKGGSGQYIRTKNVGEFIDVAKLSSLGYLVNEYI